MNKSCHQSVGYHIPLRKLFQEIALRYYIVRSFFLSLFILSYQQLDCLLSRVTF